MGLEYLKLTPSTDPQAPITVLFNPGEYTIRKGTSYAEIAIPGLDQPVVQFVRGDAETFSCELFLDSSDSPYAPGAAETLPETTAEGLRQRLHALARVNGEHHSPPVVTLSWGRRTNFFRGVVTSLTERFVLFDEQGLPWRIRVQLEMKSVAEPDAQRILINPQSPDRTRAHVVKAGDNLARIALEAYGDPGQWRRIAEANQLERPRALTPGQVLVIPAV